MTIATALLSEKVIKLDDLITDKDYRDILDSIMGGGEKWEEFCNKEGHDCLEYCPEHPKCIKRRKCAEVCSDDWAQQELNLNNLKIIFHVLNYFDYYNRGDLPALTGASKKVLDFRQFIHDKCIEAAKKEKGKG